MADLNATIGFDDSYAEGALNKFDQTSTWGPQVTGVLRTRAERRFRKNNAQFQAEQVARYDKIRCDTVRYDKIVR